MQKEHSHYKIIIPALLATLVLALPGLTPRAAWARSTARGQGRRRGMTPPEL